MLLFIKEELKEKVKIEDEKKDEEKQDPKGIPEFWLTVFKNVDLLSDMVQVILLIKIPGYLRECKPLNFKCLMTSLSIVDICRMVAFF